MTTEAFAQLVSQSRAALLAGDYEALVRLSQRGERLLATMDEGADLAPIRADITQLQNLTEAALNGVRDARRGFEKRLRAQTHLETYGPTGESRPIELRPVKHSQRA